MQGLSSYTPTFYLAVTGSKGYRSNPDDIYNNVKLPAFINLPNSIDKDGWKAVDRGSNVTYVSLLGIPATRADSKGSSTYTIKARYFNISCSSNSRVAAPAPSSLAGSWNLTLDSSPCNRYPCRLHAYEPSV